MIGPNDINLPFFAYGVFRKGELGFLSISDLVSRVVEPCSVTGSLLLRDGLPIIDPAGRSNIPGSLISFREGLNGEAYDRIDRLEPHRQYRWEETTTAQSVRCNYLIGRSPHKGSVPADEGWNGRNDPLFTSALEVVNESLAAYSDFDSKADVQAANGLSSALVVDGTLRFAALSSRRPGCRQSDADC